MLITTKEGLLSGENTLSIKYDKVRGWHLDMKNCGELTIKELDDILTYLRALDRATNPPATSNWHDDR